jgi:hypothetical protein
MSELLKLAQELVSLTTQETKMLGVVMKTYDIIELQKLDRTDLIEIAESFRVNIYPEEGKQVIMYQILEVQAEKLKQSNNSNFNIGLHDYSTRF